ncbi:conserved hypothetical protein, partial [Ricinus communis]
HAGAEPVRIAAGVVRPVPVATAPRRPAAGVRRVGAAHRGLAAARVELGEIEAVPVGRRRAGRRARHHQMDQRGARELLRPVAAVGALCERRRRPHPRRHRARDLVHVPGTFADRPAAHRERCRHERARVPIVPVAGRHRCVDRRGDGRRDALRRNPHAPLAR